MNNYIGPGNSVAVVMPYARNAGEGVLVGGLFGVAVNTYASGATGQIITAGVFTNLVKASGAAEAWAVGDRLYWSDSNKNLTKNSTGNFAVGVALAAIGTAVTTAGEVMVRPSAATGS
jgi:predicted RecA/RadA family phage recombinase